MHAGRTEKVNFCRGLTFAKTGYTHKQVVLSEEQTDDVNNLITKYKLIQFWTYMYCIRDITVVNHNIHSM